ncbi:DUF2339 domain-containing protein [Devosia sp. ZB163]|uniref:DUF2339 domain-containing protein n=1 Tax=Devosia sp. ZB163 TaxID=3025938 RepID=UPI00235F400A|nr:DUF2339 domain-containing protein [Devosia sp. ZB163]MDC9823766.1 DUF2339 domain-containing protein [Devosia sp. ZB163]
MEWMLVAVLGGLVAYLFHAHRQTARAVEVLETRLNMLRTRLGEIEDAQDAAAKPRARAKPKASVRETLVVVPAEIEPAPAVVSTRAWPHPDPAETRAAPGAEAAAEPAKEAAFELPPPPPPASKPKEIDWERTLGVRLPVWGGAIMLLIAGYFLVNWAIEAGAGLFTPTVRVVLCGLAAAGLFAAAVVVKARRIANGDRIASALATAAIAVAYGTMFLAASVFQLVPGPVALIGAGLVTLAAIGISTQFGQKVMVVGLLGGYLSPFFAWSVGSSSGLVPIYVVALFTASMFAIRWNGWWGQGIPALVAPALWALGLVDSSDPVTLAVLYLLLAVVPAALMLSPLRDDAGAREQRSALVILASAAAGACLAFGTYLHESHTAFLAAMVLFGLGGAALVIRYGVALRPAWVATLAVAVLTLISWRQPDGLAFLLVALLLAGTHLGALAIQFRAGIDRAALSFALAGLSALLFVILLVKLDGWLGARDVPYLWAAIGLAIAAGYAWLAVRHNEASSAYGPAAGFAVGGSAFLSLALGLVLDPGLYALVAALQAFGLSLLYLKFRDPVLRQMHMVYVALYAALLALGQVGPLVSQVFGGQLAGWLDFVPMAGVQDQPVTLLLLPGLLFLAASTVFARVAYSTLPWVLDGIGVALLALAVHFLMVPGSPWGLFEQPLVVGSWWFNAQALLALASIYAASRTGRTMLFQAGIGLAVVVALAMAATVMVPVFRFWPWMETPGLPVFNAALTGIGLPTALLLATAYVARRQGSLQFARALAAFGGLGGLVTILVLIRQAIHGPTLQGPGLVPAQIELYLYSGGMLVYGFALLLGGVAFSSLALRGGSLVVVLATIGKVFLYDVSGLEGLWRVGSFLGMGIALLAVSWFYGRFVFGIGPSGRKVEVEATG